MKKITLFLLLVLPIFKSQAQSADEIVNKYIDVIGGKAKLDAIKSIQMEAKVDQMGMTFPINMVNMRNGKMFVKFSMSGNEFTQIAFDGTDSWGTNFSTMLAEKNDSETTENIKRNAGEFITPLYNYKANGCTLEKLEDEKVEGVDCFKLKLTKKPSLSEGKEVPNVEFYFIDKETYALIIVETEIMSGEAKGSFTQTLYSDYQEVDGVYFPFSITNRMKGGEGQAMIVTKITINPQVDEKVFAFPG